jgi:hypothetical protein
MKKQNSSDWKIIKRTFKALKHPKGSPERNKLNRSSITSEYARYKKYLVVDSDNKPLKSFKTLLECQYFINHPDEFKPDKKIKKYTRKDFVSGRDWYVLKRKRLKFT